MKTVWILKGLPASGKTTWAKEQVAKSNCAIKRVNKDDLRLMLDSGRHSKGNESYVLQMRDNIILTALDLGKSVIVDDTNFHPKHEERIRELVRDFNKGLYGDNNSLKNPVQVKIRYFYITPEEAIKRDLKRPNSVGAKVIWNMYNEYLKPKEDSEKSPELLKQNPKLPHAIICDLDGTIALMNGRSPYEYEKCDTDLLNKPIKKLLLHYCDHADIPIIFLSGRDGSSRDKTLAWLKKHNLILDMDSLYMREAGDNRKDCIIKKELFDKYIKDKYYIDLVLDDRNQIVEMWRNMGLTCLQVADGDF